MEAQFFFRDHGSFEAVLKEEARRQVAMARMRPRNSEPALAGQ